MTMEEPLVFECNGVPIWAKYRKDGLEEAEYMIEVAWTELVAHVKTSYYDKK